MSYELYTSNQEGFRRLKDIAPWLLKNKIKYYCNVEIPIFLISTAYPKIWIAVFTNSYLTPFSKLNLVKINDNGMENEFIVNEELDYFFSKTFKTARETTEEIQKVLYYYDLKKMDANFSQMEISPNLNKVVGDLEKLYISKQVLVANPGCQAYN